MPAFYDPNQAQQNALRTGIASAAVPQNAMRIKDQQERTNLLKRADKRAQRGFEMEQLQQIARAANIKDKHIAKAAAKIYSMPPGQMDQAYKNVIENIAPTPIGHVEGPDGRPKPVGVADVSFYLPFENFKKLKEQEKRDYLKQLSRTQEELAALDLLDAKSQAAINKIAAEWENTKKEYGLKSDLLEEDFGYEMQKIRERGKYDIAAKKAGSSGAAAKMPPKIKASMDIVKKGLTKAGGADQATAIITAMRGGDVNSLENARLLFQDLPERERQFFDDALERVDEWMRGGNKEINLSADDFKGYVTSKPGSR